MTTIAHGRTSRLTLPLYLAAGAMSLFGNAAITIVPATHSIRRMAPSAVS